MLTSPPDPLTHADVTAYWNRTCRDGRSRSHWREAMPEDWQRIWVTHGDMLREQWPEVVDLPGAIWVEWGSGGGANAVMLAEIASRVYCVDISGPSLGVCMREMEMFGQGGFVWVLADVDNPEEVLGRVPRLDGFLSTSTFQHFPSKEYTERIVWLIPRLVRPGGYVFVQIRRDGPENHRPDVELPYEQRAMYATVYDVDEFGDLLAAHGVDVEKVENIDRGQYSYFFGRVNSGANDA